MMTETDLRRLAEILRESQPPPPRPSSIGAGTFLLGFLIVAAVLLFWPELRAGLAGFYAQNFGVDPGYSQPLHALIPGPG